MCFTPISGRDSKRHKSSEKLLLRTIEPMKDSHNSWLYSNESVQTVWEKREGISSGENVNHF